MFGIKEKQNENFLSIIFSCTYLYTGALERQPVKTSQKQSKPVGPTTLPVDRLVGGHVIALKHLEYT